MIKKENYLSSLTENLHSNKFWFKEKMKIINNVKTPNDCFLEIVIFSDLNDLSIYLYSTDNEGTQYPLTYLGEKHDALNLFGDFTLHNYKPDEEDDFWDFINSDVDDVFDEIEEILLNTFIELFHEVISSENKKNSSSILLF